jgi:hypothetical protein
MPGNRRSIRLKNYDYTKKGAYYITICANDRTVGARNAVPPLNITHGVFGHIENEKMFLNELGKIVDKCWNEIPDHFPNIELDEYIVMPDHVHGIIHMRAGLPHDFGRGDRDFGRGDRAPTSCSHDNVRAGFPRPSLGTSCSHDHVRAGFPAL